MLRWVSRASLFFLLSALSACSFFHLPDHFGATPISWDAMRGWREDDQSRALAAFLQSCPILAKKPEARTSSSGIVVPQNVWQSLCDEAGHVAPSDTIGARLFFERRFAAYRIDNHGSEEGLFTGYFEPLLYGSLHKGGDFLYPVYMPPRNLTHAFTRQEIDNGAIAKRKYELVWVDDPVMLFFMQIQGSGRIKLTNGRTMRVGFADKNGRDYVALGKVLADEGLLPKDQINFFTLRQWLYTHHDQAFAIMQRNPSYVFFTRVEGAGPIGAVGAALTPQRSLAVDSRYIPYGLPVFLETELPAEPQEQPVVFHRLMIAQDTGGAIKGPVRGDIFFGSGDEAEYLAGYMKNQGVYTMLVPKEVVGELGGD